VIAAAIFFRGALTISVGLLSVGCQYVVSSETLTRVDALRSQDRDRAAVEARSSTTGAGVYLWANAVEPIAPPVGGAVLVKERAEFARTAMAISGVLLTTAGAGIIIGGVSVLPPRCPPNALCIDFETPIAGFLMALGGAVVISGVALQIVGWRRVRSAKAPSGRPDVLYFDAPRVTRAKNPP
jgi:hypothetical protein